MDRDTRHIARTQMNRRTVLRAGAVAGTAALLGAMGAPALAGHRPGNHTDDNAQVEPEAGTWRTWVLQSGDQLRLPKPPIMA